MAVAEVPQGHRQNCAQERRNNGFPWGGGVAKAQGQLQDRNQSLAV